MKRTLFVKDIHKTFDGKTILNHVNAAFTEGSVYCLTGTSGIGKTTLLRILLGLDSMDEGCLFWAFQTPSSMQQGRFPDGIIPRFSAVFQENRLCESFSPLENISMVTKQKPFEITNALCQLLPKDAILRPTSTLSGGMKRRVSIARALLAPSDILIMDEPFTGLDENTKKTTIRFIIERLNGKLLLVTTHHPEDITLLNGISIPLNSIQR